jgi:general stress protein 26
MTQSLDRPPKPTSGPTAKTVRRDLAKHSFCVLATASAEAVPHAVGVLYAYVGGKLYIATGEATKKARNVRANPNVAVTVAVRKYPVGPPFTIQFQGQAEVIGRSDPDIKRLLEAGKLKKIVGFGVLNEPDLCFIRITPAARVQTYGLGIPLRQFLRDVSHADRSVKLS